MTTMPANSPRSIRVKSGDLTLRCLEWGPPRGFPIVLLHGLRGHAHAWDDVARALSTTYRVIAVDQRGRGESDWAPDGDYSMQAFVRDIAGLCEALDLESIALVGHSMGGRNGIMFAATYPERVTTFIVVDVGPEVAPEGAARIRDEVIRSPERFHSLDDAVALARQENALASHEVIRRRLEFQTMPHADSGITWRYDPVIREQVRMNTRAKPPDLWEMWRRIKCPVLIVRGAETDVLSPEILERMTTVRSDFETVQVARAGHTVFEDNPADFVVVVSRWLDDHIVTPDRA
jgi:esterase